MNIKDVQSTLPEYWTDQQYPDEFNNSAMPHRHYTHAITHSMKALGNLAAFSDAMDHQRMQNRAGAQPDEEALAYKANAPKWLADMVICTARMAEQIGADLERAVNERIQTLKDRHGGK